MQQASSLFDFWKHFCKKLQCRLERMERRMSVLKHKDESHDIHEQLSCPSKHVKSPLSHHQSFLRTQLPKSHHETSHPPLLKRRKNFKWSANKKHKRQITSESSLKHFEQVNEAGVSGEANKREDNEEENVTEDDEDDGSELSEGHERSNGANEETSESETEPEDDKIDYTIMQTDVMYHLYYPRHVCAASPDAKRLQEQIEVETPSWRLNPLTNMYQLEGTENITDEAYIKRHQKSELEEKRRKRWDLQRIRELQALEKLERQRENEIRASHDEADMETFLPSIHELKHIEITECVPVMAFGRPIPYVSPAEFEVPWEINSSAAQYSSPAGARASTLSRRH